MFIKVSIKEGAEYDSAKESAAYSLMTNMFSTVVFCGNLAGYVEAGGSFVVIKIGFSGGVDYIRETITEIWEREVYQYQPDDLLEISVVHTMLG